MVKVMAVRYVSYSIMSVRASSVLNECLFAALRTDQWADPVTEEFGNSVDFFIQVGGMNSFVFFAKNLLRFLQFIGILRNRVLYLILPGTVKMVDVYIWHTFIHNDLKARQKNTRIYKTKTAAR